MDDFPDELEEINNYLRQIQDQYNNMGISDFEGYSPHEMRYVLYDPLGANSPVQLLKLSDTDYKKVPILNQIKYLLQLVGEHGELKLTAKGFLPTKIVADIYRQKFIKDEIIESGLGKLYKETDSKTINLTRILAELSGLVKKRKNKLSLTKKAKAELNDNDKLLKNVILTFATKFNWAYYDGYGQNEVGRLGFAFSLILLAKYGATKRNVSFYAEKYLKAFPELLRYINLLGYEDPKIPFYRAYALRTFYRFLDYFGVIEPDTNDSWHYEKFVRKTELFDKLIYVRPPGSIFIHYS